MTQCIKTFINSLYGKYGEKHHDLNFIMEDIDIEDEDKFKNVINTNIAAIKNIKKMSEYT